MIHNNKKLIRQEFLDIRKKISPEQRDLFSEKISNTLRNFFEAENFSGYIALFAGTENEVDLLSFVETNYNLSLQKKIKFCFPKITNSKNGEMEFFAVEKISDLEIGKFGILEPKKQCKKVDNFDISIFCIPAVSIDKKGNRIGMGGGFYDRYLSKVSGEVVKLGIIFACQKSTEIFETQKFDIPVDKIITEGETNCNLSLRNQEISSKHRILSRFSR